MKISKVIIIILFAFLLSILDTSFFSFLPIFGATIISSYDFIINFSIMGKSRDFVFFTTVVVFFFSIFSSLPIWFVVLSFLVVPYAIFYVRNVYFTDPSVLASSMFFGIATFVFSFISMIYRKSWSESGIVALIYFVIINSVFGVALYYLSKRIRKNFTRAEIKF